jgi:hypothetical protein
MPDRPSTTVFKRLHHNLKIGLNCNFVYLVSFYYLGLAILLCSCGRIVARIGLASLSARLDGRAEGRVRFISTLDEKLRYTAWISVAAVKIIPVVLRMTHRTTVETWYR